MWTSTRQSLILITSTFAARLDMRGRDCNPCGKWIRIPKGNQSNLGLVQTLLKHKPIAKGKLWIAAADFWTGLVSLPRHVAGNLNDDELAQALALESEPFSGRRPDEVLVGRTQLHGPTSETEWYWWVNLVPQKDWEQLEALCRTHSLKLAGIGTPFLFQLTATDDSSYRSTSETRDDKDEFEMENEVVQIWNNTVIRSRWSSSELLDWSCSEHTGSDSYVKLREDIGSNAKTLSKFCLVAEQPSNELLTPEEVIDLPQADFWLLSNESDLNRWGSAWIASTHGRWRHPIASKVINRPPQAAKWIAAASFSMATATCTAHYSHSRNTLLELRTVSQHMESRRQAEEQVVRKINLLKSEEALLKRQLEQTYAHNEKVEKQLRNATEKLAQNQFRWSILLECLVNDSEVWIRKLSSSEELFRVHGTCLDEESIHRFAASLEQQLHGIWEVRPAKSKRNDESGLFEFELELHASESVSNSKKIARNDQLPARTNLQIIGGGPLK